MDSKFRRYTWVNPRVLKKKEKVFTRHEGFGCDRAKSKQFPNLAKCFQYGVHKYNIWPHVLNLQFMGWRGGYDLNSAQVFSVDVPQRALYTGKDSHSFGLGTIPVFA